MMWFEIGDEAGEDTDDTEKGGRMMIMKRERRNMILGILLSPPE